MDRCNGRHTPLDANSFPLRSTSSVDKTKRQLYQSIVGSINFNVIVTRFDVSCVSCFLGTHIETYDYDIDLGSYTEKSPLTLPLTWSCNLMPKKKRKEPQVGQKTGRSAKGRTDGQKETTTRANDQRPVCHLSGVWN
jgi:hypothetical protein